eukprot:40756_1
MNVNYFSELDGQDLTTLDRKTLYNHLKEARQADKSYQIIPKNIRNAKWNQHPNVLISELRQYMESVTNHYGEIDDPSENHNMDIENESIDDQQLEQQSNIENEQLVQQSNNENDPVEEQNGKDYKVFTDLCLFGEAVSIMRDWLNNGLGEKLMDAFDGFAEEREDIKSIDLTIAAYVKSLRADSYSKYTDLLDRLRWFGNQHGSQIKKMVSIIKQLHSVGIVMNADIDYMIANNKPSYRLGWGGVFNDDDFAEERQGVHNIVKKMVIKAIKLRKEKDSMNIMSVEDKMKGLENRKNEMEELDYLRQMNELRKEQSLN